MERRWTVSDLLADSDGPGSISLCLLGAELISLGKLSKLAAK